MELKGTFVLVQNILEIHGCIFLCVCDINFQWTFYRIPIQKPFAFFKWVFTVFLFFLKFLLLYSRDRNTNTKGELPCTALLLRIPQCSGLGRAVDMSTESSPGLPCAWHSHCLLALASTGSWSQHRHQNLNSMRLNTRPYHGLPWGHQDLGSCSSDLQQNTHLYLLLL